MCILEVIKRFFLFAAYVPTAFTGSNWPTGYLFSDNNKAIEPDVYNYWVVVENCQWGMLLVKLWLSLSYLSSV